MWRNLKKSNLKFEKKKNARIHPHFNWRPQYCPETPTQKRQLGKIFVTRHTKVSRQQQLQQQLQQLQQHQQHKQQALDLPLL